MGSKPRWRRLLGAAAHVDADPRLVRQLLAAVVTQSSGELAGHRFARVRSISTTEAEVRFEIKLLGRDFTTVERVTADEDGVSFQQMAGVLPGVEERISIIAAGTGADLSYSGRYLPRPGTLGRTLGALAVRAIYWREAQRTLQAVKLASEARQARSALFRRPS